MRRILALVLAASCVLTSASSPAGAQVSAGLESPGKFRKVSDPLRGRYTVILEDGVSRSKVPALAAELAPAHGGKVLYVYGRVLKGFAVELPEAAAVALSRDPRVKYVEEDYAFTVTGSHPTPQDSSFYGIDRIDQRFGLGGTYNYNRVGSGVHVYVLDTGIRTTHKEFGTRADVFRDFITGAVTNNHGTFVAGLIGARNYGVAKNAQIHSVRVCRDFDGMCPATTVAAGLDAVTQFGNRPAVVNMSFSVRLGPNAPQQPTAMEEAMLRAIGAGVTCVTGAGNGRFDPNTQQNIPETASWYTPARRPEVITVGATDKFDNRASYSNFGPALDLFAPGGESVAGQFIPTPSAASDTDIDGFTGTSASSPHVAGIAALYLEANPSASHFQVRDQIVFNATGGAVANAGFGSPNLMAYAGFVTPPASNPVDDSRFFVRQHYYDFLRKQPDQGGWDFWTGEITQCADPARRGPGETEAQCVDRKRVDVSRAFWYSGEFLNAHPGLRNPPGVAPDFDNREFVRLCYVIYLQRDPDQSGWDFWTSILNGDTANDPGPNGYNHIIRAFLVSGEYRARFQ